jgi:hypothetical protein
LWIGTQLPVDRIGLSPSPSHRMSIRRHFTDESTFILPFLLPPPRIMCKQSWATRCAKKMFPPDCSALKAKNLMMLT